MKFTVLEKTDRERQEAIKRRLLDGSCLTRVLSSEVLKNIPWADFRLFCHFEAIYQYPTTELLEFLTDVFNGNNGAFQIKGRKGRRFNVVASDGSGWEHVSVSCADRCPTWEEMCWIKEMFWDDEDCVIQYHPPKKDYVNMHPFCLHLWRPTDREIPIPDPVLVGVKSE